MTRFIKGEFVLVPNKSQALALRGATLNVYLALCSYADKDGGCFPSYGTMSGDIQYTTRACKDAIEELVDLGLITKETRQRPNGSNTSNYYQIVIQSIGGVNHSSLGSEPQFTTITQPTKSAKADNTPKKGGLLLSLVNTITHRNFRTLPDRGVKKTLDAFTLEEIERALRAMAADEWHKERMKTLPLPYFIRSTTIDRFLTDEETPLTAAEINAKSSEEAKQAMADADRHIKELSDD